MEKLYDRIDWNNNTTPALNETNLNAMSKAVDDIDDRVIEIAGTVMETVPQVQEDLAEAQELLEDAEAITTHPPMIGQNGNWWTWDTATDDYVDSGIDAGVSIEIGTTTTLPAGSSATVTNSGTDTDPILNFGIPKGDKGDSGEGIPTGGTTGQVLAKKSDSNYDTEWKTIDDNKAYHTDDTAETALADGDYIPFYDTSASAKRKSLWSNIKSVLKTYFDTLYSAKATSKGSATKGVYFDSNGAVKEMTYSVSKSVPSDAVFTDTKNTAGSTDSSSKLFLIGATSQAANPQTYSQDTAYVGTDGCLYSNSTKVLTAHQDISGKADKVSSATNGNFAGLDSNGNLTDSGKKAGDFLTSHQTIKQDGVTGATVNRFGTCSTAAGTAAKTVSITTGTFALEAGARVSVKFSNANTAGTPTLNVNSKGAKNIYHKGSQITTGDNKALLAGVCDFIYDGTQWHLVGNYIDNNTTYASKGSATKGVYFDSNGAAQEMTYSVSKNVPSNAVFTDVNVLQTNMDGTNENGYLLFGSGSSTATEGVFKSSHLKYNPYTQDLSVLNINGYPTTPDYVDEQYSSSTTYSKGMTCISGNVRYRYINSTASSGHQPPNVTYWEVLSVASQLGEIYEEGEYKIGTFLGKDLYRRVFKVNLTLPEPTGDPNYITYLTPMPTGYVTKIDAVLDIGNGAILQTSSGGDIVIMWSVYNNGQIVIYHKNATSSPTYVKAIIVEYTKQKWT